MAEHDEDGGEREEGRQGGGYGNLFKIIDMIVFELNRTKRMFLIMILSVMIIPPVSLFITSVIFVPPFEHGGDGGGRIGPGGGDGAGPPPPDRTTGFLERFFSTRNVPLLISIIWLGVGIRQWFVLSKWTKRYEQYKKRRDEADRKFDESISESSNIGPDNSGH
jgi:hypothetical protein